MKHVLTAAILALALLGCASFHTRQTEYNPTNGLPVKSTTVHIRSFFDSHNDVTKLRTTFTEKSQGIGVGAISENTSGTNTIELISRISAGATEGAIRALATKP